MNAVWSPNGEESWYFKLVIKSWQSHLVTSFKRTAKHQIGRCCTAFVGRLVGTWCSVFWSSLPTFFGLRFGCSGQFVNPKLLNHQMGYFWDMDNSWDKVFADRICEIKGLRWCSKLLLKDFVDEVIIGWTWLLYIPLTIPRMWECKVLASYMPPISLFLSICSQYIYNHK